MPYEIVSKAISASQRWPLTINGVDFLPREGLECTSGS